MSENARGIRQENVSLRKLPIVQSASFDTLVTAILAKSQLAQRTFIRKLIETVDGDVLQDTIKYSTKEMKHRAKTVPVQ
jgi:hypothetical protein